MWQRHVVFMITFWAWSSCIGFGQERAATKRYFGNGLNYEAPDTSFGVKFQFRIQSLFQVDFNESSDQTTSRFLIRRSRIKLSGFAFHPDLEFKTELGLTSRDIAIKNEDGNTGGASRYILDAVLKWKFTKDDRWTLLFGQTKLPGNRERIVSSGSLQFVDRSILNSRFNIDRDQGFQLHGKLSFGGVLLLPKISVSQGEGRNISAANIGGLDYSARLDFLPFGKFSDKGDYVEGDLVKETKPKISIGVAYDYNDRAVRQGGQLGRFVKDINGNYVENSLETFFADLMFKYKGWSVLSEYARKTGSENIVDSSSGFLTGSAFTAQLGYLLESNVEIASRYSFIRKDISNSAIIDQDQFTLGISKYISDHNLKIQSDVSRSSFPNDDTRYQFRFQVEMQF